MSGKNDVTKVDGEKTQTRILNDYLRNLHEKFLSGTNTRISFTAFCERRPKNILTTALLSRNTCLCTIHQNMAFKLKCLRSLNINIAGNPEVAIHIVTATQMKEQLCTILCDRVEFEQWKRVDIVGKKKMIIVKSSIAKQEFIEIMTN